VILASNNNVRNDDVPRLPFCGPLNYEREERLCAIQSFLCFSVEVAYAKSLTPLAFKWSARVSIFSFLLRMIAECFSS
jgi:hypothetical protein